MTWKSCADGPLDVAQGHGLRRVADRVAQGGPGEIQVEPLAGQHGLRDDGVQRPFQLADAGPQVFGDVGDDRLGDVDPAQRGSRLEDRAASGQVGRLDLDDHPAQESGDQLVGQPMDQPRVLVGRQDDRGTFIDERVEGMEELVLGGPLGGEEMDIVHDQAAGAAEPGAEAAQAAGAHGLEEAVGERLGGELDDVQARVCAPQGMADRLEQMRLAHARCRRGSPGG